MHSPGSSTCLRDKPGWELVGQVVRVGANLNARVLAARAPEHRVPQQFAHVSAQGGCDCLGVAKHQNCAEPCMQNPEMRLAGRMSEMRYLLAASKK